MVHLRMFMIASVVTVFISGGPGLAAQDSATAEPCAEATASAEASPGASPAASTAASPEASPAASPESANTECTVDIRDLAFDPSDIEVAVGTTVTWVNNDTVPHTATASDGAFDSGVFDPEERFSYTFDETGRVDYSCLLHPEMQGSVTVR